MKPVWLGFMDPNVTIRVQHIVSTDAVVPQVECVTAVWQAITGTTVTCLAATVRHVIRLMVLAEENAIVAGMGKSVSRCVLLTACLDSVTDSMEPARRALSEELASNVKKLLTLPKQIKAHTPTE